jgi:hypothetical protein
VKVVLGMPPAHPVRFVWLCRTCLPTSCAWLRELGGAASRPPGATALTRAMEVHIPSSEEGMVACSLAWLLLPADLRLHMDSCVSSCVAAPVRPLPLVPVILLMVRHHPQEMKYVCLFFQSHGGSIMLEKI